MQREIRLGQAPRGMTVALAAVLSGALWLLGCGAPPAASGSAAPATELVVVISGLDTMRFTPDTLTVKRGQTVRITFKNVGIVPHDLVSQGARQNLHLVGVAKGREAQGTFMATEPGIYPLVCTQPAHKEAGMVGRITVE